MLSTPGPICSNVPVPLMKLLIVNVPLRLIASVPLLAKEVLFPSAPAAPPAPICNVPALIAVVPSIAAAPRENQCPRAGLGQPATASQADRHADIIAICIKGCAARTQRNIARLVTGKKSLSLRCARTVPPLMRSVPVLRIFHEAARRQHPARKRDGPHSARGLPGEDRPRHVHQPARDLQRASARVAHIKIAGVEPRPAAHRHGACRPARVAQRRRTSREEAAAQAFTVLVPLATELSARLA